MSVEDLIERLQTAVIALGAAFAEGEQELRSIAKLVENDEAKRRILAIAEGHKQAAELIKLMDARS